MRLSVRLHGRQTARKNTHANNIELLRQYLIYINKRKRCVIDILNSIQKLRIDHLLGKHPTVWEKHLKEKKETWSF